MSLSKFQRQIKMDDHEVQERKNSTKNVGNVDGKKTENEFDLEPPMSKCDQYVAKLYIKSLKKKLRAQKRGLKPEKASKLLDEAADMEEMAQQIEQIEGNKRSLDVQNYHKIADYEWAKVKLLNIQEKVLTAHSDLVKSEVTFKLGKKRNLEILKEKFEECKEIHEARCRDAEVAAKELREKRADVKTAGELNKEFESANREMDAMIRDFEMNLKNPVK